MLPDIKGSLIIEFASALPLGSLVVRNHLVTNSRVKVPQRTPLVHLWEQSDLADPLWGTHVVAVAVAGTPARVPIPHCTCLSFSSVPLPSGYNVVRDKRCFVVDYSVCSHLVLNLFWKYKHGEQK